jgi:hypothetical protein
MDSYGSDSSSSGGSNDYGSGNDNSNNYSSNDHGGHQHGSDAGGSTDSGTGSNDHHRPDHRQDDAPAERPRIDPDGPGDQGESSPRRKPVPAAPSRDDDSDAAVGLGFGVSVGAPQPADAGTSGPEMHAPSGEPTSFGLDPDHGVSSTTPLADAQIPVQFGDADVPVTAFLGLNLKGWAVIGALLLTAVAGVSVAAAGEDDGDPGSYPSRGSSSEEDVTSGDSSFEGSETTAYVEPDPVAEAAIGECYFVSGTDFDAEIEWTSCGGGSFEVVDIVEYSSDLSSCDYVDAADQAVSSTTAERVLCLSYIAIDGDDAYHAQPGECIYGANEADTPWNVSDCDTGSFEVLDRIAGSTDTGLCDSGGYGLHTLTYTTSESYLDVVLCLQIVYPSDVGYAEQYTCMYMTEDGDAGYFEYSDCDDANVRITGRTDEFEASSWCEGYGWTSWINEDFPEHAYTVCWEWY